MTVNSVRNQLVIEFITIFAGPLFNFILAFFIFLMIGLLQGVPTYEPIISGVAEDGPALDCRYARRRLGYEN